MVNNITLRDMAVKLEQENSFMIFPHVYPDGDAYGASIALCLALRKMGKEAWVYTLDEAPAYVRHLDLSCCTDFADSIKRPDVCIAVDQSEESRMPDRFDKFNSGKIKMCIDHHLSKGIGDWFYVDPKASATCEIVYNLIREFGTGWTRDMANAVYTGILTDTGRFMHSNTTYEVHLIAERLMNLGVDHDEIMMNIYQSKSLIQIKTEARAFGRMELLAGGKGVITFLFKDDLKDLGAKKEHTGEIIDRIKEVDGVEMAAYLEERQDGIKVSMRSKSDSTVSQICEKFGGGGHLKAAGCTIDKPMKLVHKLISDEIEAYFAHRH